MNHLMTAIRDDGQLTIAENRAYRYITQFALHALLLTLTTGAWGQDNATITGTVADPSGAVVKNVTITLTNLATGQAREVTSNTSGAYRFADVGVGRYTLGASMQGFEKFTKTGIVVNVAATLAEDI